LLAIAYNSIRLVLSMVSTAADLPAVRSEIHSLAGWAVATVFLPALHVLLPAG
jgi:predicted metal-dependent hydrolase